MGPYNLINCKILFFICGINSTAGINAKFFHQGRVGKALFKSINKVLTRPLLSVRYLRRMQMYVNERCFFRKLN